MDKIFILIPAFNPDIKLVNLVKELKHNNTNEIMIINDGSNNKCNLIFKELLNLNCSIINHKQNKGKGAAIKTGIAALQQNQNVIGIVTADADGQHLAQDIIKIKNELKSKNEIVLGVRDFTQKNIPLASKIGNKFSSLYLKLLTGMNLTDTQTGLRGIPRKYFNYALNLSEDRYDYEMRFLEGMKFNNMQVNTVKISTIYEADRISHFHMIKDSYRIYKTLFNNIFVAVTSAIIDIILFGILLNFTYIILSTIIARIISGTYNFTLNKLWTFNKRNSKQLGKESIRYLILFIIQMFVSGTITNLIGTYLKNDFSIILLKIMVDIVIFIINFIVQKNWVFKEKKNSEA